MSVCDVPVISSVCDAVGEGAASLVAAPFDWLASAMGGAASWLFQGVWWLFDSTTLVGVTRPEYVKVYNVIFGVAIFVMLLFFCLQLITGMIRRDPTSLQKAALGMARAVLGSFLVITVTALLLEVVDQLTVGIVNATGSSMEEMGDKLAALALGIGAISIATPGVGAIITIFLAGLMIAATALIWFSLLIRKALLLMAIVLAPLALSGSAWEVTKGWFSKWASFVIALAVSKLVVVVIFLVATAQLSAPIDFDLASISEPIAGIVLLMLASFAPYLAYKLIAFMGYDMYHALSTEQEAKAAMNAPVPVPSGPRMDQAKKVLDGAKGDGGGADAPPGGGGNPPPPPPPPGGGGGAAPATAPAASSGGAAASGGGAAASGGGAAAGGGGAAAGGAAAGGAAAAGPVGIAAGAVIAGAAVAKGAAEAGPKAGAAVGGAGEAHSGAAQEASVPPPAAAQQRTAPATPGNGSPAPAAPAQSPPAQSAPPASPPPQRPAPTQKPAPPPEPPQRG